MKRLLALVVVLVLALTCLAGCSVVDTVKDKINTILGKEPEGNTQLDKADAFLFDLYKNAATETPSSYNLVSVVTIEGVKFTVTWESDNEAVTIAAAEDPNFVTVTVPKANEPIRYTLTATIKDDAGNVKTRTFQRTVPAFKVFTFAEYAAAADDATVVVRGVVSGIFSKTNGSSGNGVYIQDLNNEGGYYVYGLVDSKDPEADLGLKVGMTVTVSGIKDTYNGLYEVVSANIEIDDATIKTVEPVDFTEIYKNATALTDAALVTRQSMLVTVKGVEVGGVKEDNGYYYFKLGALESYIRISSSNNCISKADIDTFKANHTSHKGYKADVTGIIQLYNGAFYLIPVSVDVESNYAEIERTDAEKVDFEIDGITIPERVTEATSITLPAVGTKYNTVTFAWTATGEYVEIKDGKLVVTLPEETTTVTVTLVATCGEANKTVTYDIKLIPAPTNPFLPEQAPNPATKTAYKFFVYNAFHGKTFYFNGAIDDKYLQSSDNYAEAVDVYIEEVTKSADDKTVIGYRFYFDNNGTKTYIDITAEGKAALVTENPNAVYNYVAETNCWAATIGETGYYIGSYHDTKANKSYTTFSASKTSYIKPDNTGVTQFPSNFATLRPATTVPEQAETPAVGTAYKFFVYNAFHGKTFYFNGAIDDKYLQSSDNIAEAVDVYLEEVKDGETVVGYRFYFMNGETKTYIDITADGKAALVTENPNAVYTYKADVNCWAATIGETGYYIGSYHDTKANKSYTTFSASKTSYIKPDNTGVTQFPSNFATITVKKVVAEQVKTPAAATPYKFFVYNVHHADFFYFNGVIKNNFLQTTNNIYEAVDVYLEEVKDGETVVGYRFYFMDGETKTYIDINANGKADLVTENPTAVYTYKAETNCWATAAGTKECYLGSYVNKGVSYTTIGASETKYITAENTGVTQFPANFGLLAVASDKVVTDEEKVATELKGITLVGEVLKDTEVEVPAAGATYTEVVITWTVNGVGVRIRWSG